MKRFVFSSILALLLEEGKISIGSNTLPYLRVNFSLNAREKGRGFINIYGNEGE